jgi:hypothetical protein
MVKNAVLGIFCTKRNQLKIKKRLKTQNNGLLKINKFMCSVKFEYKTVIFYRISKIL